MANQKNSKESSYKSDSEKKTKYRKTLESNAAPDETLMTGNSFVLSPDGDQTKKKRSNLNVSEISLEAQ